MHEKLHENQKYTYIINIGIILPLAYLPPDALQYFGPVLPESCCQGPHCSPRWCDWYLTRLTYSKYQHCCETGSSDQIWNKMETRFVTGCDRNSNIIIIYIVRYIIYVKSIIIYTFYNKSIYTNLTNKAVTKLYYSWCLCNKRAA